MLPISRFAVRHPAATLLLAAIVVAAFVPGLTRLELRTDGRALVPAHAPEVEVDARLRAEFGINDPAVVLIDTGKPNGIYDARVLQLVQALSRRVQEVPEIGALNVSSLDTEPSDRYRPGTLRFYLQLEPFPETPEDLERLRHDVESNGLYAGTIVAVDGSAATVLFGVPDGTDRLALCNRLWSIVAEEVAAAAARDSTGNATRIADVHVLGAPFAETLLGGHILQDLGIPDRFLGARAPQRASGAAPAPTGLFALRRWVGARLGLLPLALVVMTAVFLVGYRKIAAPLLPLAQVSGCLLVVFGAMGYAGTPVYLTTAVLPIILTCVGIESEIHLLGRYRQLVAAGSVPGDKRAVVLATLAEMTRPVVGTSITTAIGFLSFALSSMQPVQAFGLFAALGIVVCMLWSLCVTPALLAALPPGWLASRTAGRPLRLGFAERLVAGVMRRRRLVLASTAALVGISWFGVRQIRVQDSWIDGFDPQSDLYRGTQTFNANFYGPHVLQVLVDMGHDSLVTTVPEAALRDRRFVLPLRWSGGAARLEQAEIRITVPDSSHFDWDPSGLSTHTWSAAAESVFVDADALVLTTAAANGSPQMLLRLEGDESLVVEVETKRLETPAGLRVVRALQDFIVGHGELTVGGALGPPDYIATTNYIMMRRSPEARRVPEEPRHVPVLWRHYGRVRGEHFVHRVVTDDRSRGLVTVYLKNANYRDTRALMQAIREYEREHLEPQGIRLTFAGDVAVSQALIGAIVQTQTQSILLSLLGILAIGVLFTRSLRYGFFIVLPCSVAVLLNFAFMGWTGMPLGVATSMFAAMILGTGVDFAIHLIERFRRERTAGRDVETALIAAASTCGPPILIDSAAMALGFGILTLSQVPANARLGAIAVLCIVTCLLATLVLLPAVIRAWGGSRNA